MELADIQPQISQNQTFTNNKYQKGTYICEVLSFFLVLLVGSSVSGMRICPVALASELLVFLPGLAGGSGGGSPLLVAEEFFDRLLLAPFSTFTTLRGISFSLAELSDESDDSDFDLLEVRKEYYLENYFNNRSTLIAKGR